VDFSRRGAQIRGVNSSTANLQSIGSLCTTFQLGVGAVLAAAKRVNVDPDVTLDGVGYYGDAAVEKIRAELLSVRRGDACRAPDSTAAEAPGVG
jgi:Zn-dependent alcohol dehydrogenase